MANISSLTELLNININEELISFDVFDTLLYRRFLKVNEVHDLTSAYALSLTGRLNKMIPGDLTLTRSVITDNLKASPHHLCEEPTLPDIWKAMLAPTQITSDELIKLSRQVSEFEFSIDSLNLYPIKGAAEALSRLKLQGKRLVAISDMYFSEKEVSDLLEKANLLEYFDRVYVSSSRNLTKQTGNLFLHVWKDQNVLPEQTLHIGDNPISDVKSPEELGGNAKLIKQEELCQTQLPNFGNRPSIYQEVGDVVKTFLFQLYLQANNDQSDHLYFMSRDGILLENFLSSWKSPLLQKFFPNFQKDIIYLSRASTCWLNIDFTKNWLEQVIGHIFWLNNGKTTPRQISKMCGIETVPSTLSPDQIYYSDTDKEMLVGHYQSANLSEKIKKEIKNKRQDVMSYLRDIGFFTKNKVHVSDIGYSGTVLRDLNTFFLQEGQYDKGLTPPHIYFHCLATNSNHHGNSIRSYPFVHFYGHPIFPHTNLKDDLKDTFSWLEYFFKHPSQGPLFGFKKENGKTIPDYSVKHSNNPNHPFEKLLSQAINRPEDITLFWMAAINFVGPLRDPILERFAHPDMATISQMSEPVYEADALHSSSRSIIYSDPNLSEWDLREAARRHDAWIPGSLLASHFGKQKNPTLPSIPHIPEKEPTASNPSSKGWIPKIFKYFLHKNEKLEFDPIFYRSAYPDLSYIQDDWELEKHFKLHGSFLGRFGTARSVSAYLLKKRCSLESIYPRISCSLAENSNDKLSIKEKSSRRIKSNNDQVPDQPSQEANVYFDQALHLHGQGKHQEAIRRLRRAINLAPHQGNFWHQLGDWLLNEHKEEEAFAAYKNGVTTSTPNLWSYIHVIRLSGKYAHYLTGLTVLKKAAAPWQNKAPWRRARAEFFHNWFENELNRLSAHPQVHLKNFFAQFSSDLASIGHNTPVNLAQKDGPVCILIGDQLDGTSRFLYRKNEFFNNERNVLLFSLDEIKNLQHALLGASVLIFNHVSISSEALDLLHYASSLGIYTLFWAGSLCNAQKIGLPDFSDMAFSDFQYQNFGLVFGHHFRNIALATFCSGVITTIPSLMPALHKLNSNSILLPSNLMSALNNISSMSENASTASFKIFLDISGRPAFVKRAIALPKAMSKISQPTMTQHDVLLSLSEIIEKHSDIEFFVSGTDTKIEINEYFGGRLNSIPSSLTDEQRLSLISAMDLVLDFRFSSNDYLSLWADASIAETACLELSDKLPTKENIEHACPENCMISPDENIASRILEAVNSVQLRDKLIQFQKENLDSLNTYSPPNSWNLLPSATEAPSRKRILFVNIYAPPQVIGGATRVLMDNLKYFKDHSSEIFDSFVLASDDENSSRGELTIETWRNIPIFRLATPQEIDMDWRAYNAEIDNYTRRILRFVKPALVHIHCLTRLSVAVAQACKAMNIPYIITLHDAWWVSDFAFLTDENGSSATLDKNPAEQSYSKRIGLARSLERAAYLRAALSNAEMLLGVSDSFSSLFEKIGFPTTTIANGVSSLIIHDRIPSPKNVVRLGHIGGLESHKGAHLLEAALQASDFKNLSLTILDHAMPLGTERKTLWGDTPVTIRSKFLADEISKFYAAIDVLIAPSTWPESYGLVAKEAAICGCWVIANKNGAMGESICDNKNGFLVETDSPRELTAVLAKINANPSFYQTPPSYQKPIRHTDKQAAELLELYDKWLSK